MFSQIPDIEFQRKKSKQNLTVLFKSYYNIDKINHLPRVLICLYFINLL